MADRSRANPGRDGPILAEPGDDERNENFRPPGRSEEKEDTVKLFVGGLAWATDDASMRAAFQPFGNLSDAVVIKDRETGRSRGFGFVTYSDDASGKAALQAMNGASLDGRSIRCDEAVERERGAGGPPPRLGGDRPPPQGGFAGGGGGFSGGGGGGGGGGFSGGGGGGGGGGFSGGGGGGGCSGPPSGPPRSAGFGGAPGGPPRGGPPPGDRGRDGGGGDRRGAEKVRGGGGAGKRTGGGGGRRRQESDDFGDD